MIWIHQRFKEQENVVIVIRAEETDFRTVLEGGMNIYLLVVINHGQNILIELYCKHFQYTTELKISTNFIPKWIVISSSGIIFRDYEGDLRI